MSNTTPMDVSELDQYFELALDLPRKQRESLLARLDAEQPELGSRLREMLATGVTNPDFQCETGVGGASRVGTPRALDHLDHVAVQVPDIAAAVAWYRERFACEVDYEDPTWALLRFANARLALVVPDQHPAHFAVCRDDITSFGEPVAHRDGTRSVYTRDPWGNSVEILDTRSLGN